MIHNMDKAIQKLDNEFQGLLQIPYHMIFSVRLKLTSAV